MAMLRWIRAGGLAALLALATIAPAYAGSLTLLGVGQATGAAPPGTAPVYANQGTTTIQAGNSITLDKPTGLVLGDLICAVLDPATSSQPTWVLPSGWSIAGAQPWADTYAVTVACGVASSGDVAASNFTFTDSANGENGILGATFRVTGVNQTTPINANSHGHDVTGTTGNLVGLTTTVPNTLIMQFGAFSWSTTPTGSQWARAAPAGSTMGVNASTTTFVNRDLASADFVQATAGAATGKTVPLSDTANSTDDFQSVTIAIAPP